MKKRTLALILIIMIAITSYWLLPPYVKFTRSTEFWVYSWTQGNWHFFANNRDSSRLHKVNKQFPFISFRLTSTPKVMDIKGTTDWLFFMNYSGAIGRVDYRGKEESVLPNVLAHNFDVSEEHVYFLERYSSHLYVSDGRESTVLVSAQCSGLQVAKEGIYFTANGRDDRLEPGLYRINFDGSNLERLLPEHEFVLYGDNIYYISEQEGNTIWVYNTANRETQQIDGTRGSMKLISKEQGVYFTHAQSAHIFLINPNDRSVSPIK